MAFSADRDDSLATILERVTDTEGSSISSHSRLGHEISEEAPNIATQHKPTTPKEILSERTTERIGTAEPGARAAATQEDELIKQFLVRHFKNDILRITPREDDIDILFQYTMGLKLDAKPDDVEQAKEPCQEVTMKLSIAALSRMRMRKLQMELINRIMKMHYLKELPSDWESLLEKYITATRDNDYVHTWVDGGLQDPFLITSERKVDAAILQSTLLEIGGPTFNFVPPLEQKPTAIGDTRTEMTQKLRRGAYFVRAVVSVIGGIYLIMPVWLMIEMGSPKASLIITALFVLIVGLAAAWVFNDIIHVFSITVAYAAVLVVFVGANGSSA
ncbi:hypothetical protein F5Y00DRAFT_269487 [Daldinia vernicosa]|uniref:uncharacterized protein n=1 Tax=Daldinia vernicosa TaxID=114800 RepID=UPI002008D988|nr:uncharacterized protein F5Y00DRAFT_269487 [Daldinia vernicosa]KAI0849484.1 hypothetical protein F5Y00DRAFT_269487 [Daldinia vernicosa]